jgi:hypothetical protein
MAQRPVSKVQMNSWIPENIEEFVEQIHQSTNIGKSEIIHMFIAYFRVNYTTEQIKSLFRDMLVFGETGLKKEDRYVA